MSNPEVSAEMPKYVCHKVVHALKIELAETCGDVVKLWPVDKEYGFISVTSQWIAEKTRGKDFVDGKPDYGYYVVYEDGYVSWSPTEAFEKGYTRLGPLGHIARLSSSSPWVTTLRALVDALGKYAAKDISSEVSDALESAHALLRDGVSIAIRPVDPLEAALIDLANAKDGRGLLVRLLPSTDYSSAALRKATTDFQKIDFETTEFFGRDSSEKSAAMAAWYRNLALLARATAEAIDFDMRRHGV